MGNVFETKSYGGIVRVNPWPTVRFTNEASKRRGGRKEPVSLSIPVRRAGVIVRELTSPLTVGPKPAA